MLDLDALERRLTAENARFELIHQDTSILSAQDGARYFDPRLAAPTLVLQTDQGYMSLIFSAPRGRLDFSALREKAGLAKCRLADPKRVARDTGYQAGAIPLVGLDLPCLFDKRLLDFEFIYGGTGDPLCTLKIAPQDVARLNPVTLFFDDLEGRAT